VIKVWDPATGKEIAEMLGHNSPVTHLALSRDGKALASGTFYREIKVWDLENQKEIASFDNDRASVYGLALAADGKRLLSSSGVDMILWDVAKGEPVRRFKGSSGFVGRVAFSPDEKWVLARAIGYTVWDAHTAERLATLESAGGPQSLAISPDGTTLFSCDRKGNVQLLQLPKR
jgi:WD40 repeat protein